MNEKLTVWEAHLEGPDVTIEAYREFSDDDGMKTGPITVAARPGDGADGRVAQIRRVGNWELALNGFLGLLDEYGGKAAVARFRPEEGVAAVAAARAGAGWPERGTARAGDEVAPEEARAYLAETVSRALERDLEPPLGGRRPGERIRKLFADRKAERVDFADLSLAQWRLAVSDDPATRRYAAMRGLGLEVLALDADAEVARAASARDGYHFGSYVASRENPLPEERGALWAGLTRAQRDWVRSGNAAARVRAAGEGLGLDYLFDDPAPAVRAAVAAQGFALDALASDRSKKVREAALAALGGETAEAWAEANPAATAASALRARGGDKPALLEREKAGRPSPGKGAPDAAIGPAARADGVGEEKEIDSGLEPVKQVKSAPDGGTGFLAAPPAGSGTDFLLSARLVEMVRADAEKNGRDPDTAVRDMFELVQLQVSEAVASFAAPEGPEAPRRGAQIDVADRAFCESSCVEDRIAVAEAGLYLDALWGDPEPEVQRAVEASLRACGQTIEDWTDGNPGRCYHPVNRLRGMELDAISNRQRPAGGRFGAEPGDIAIAVDRDGAETATVAIPREVFCCEARVQVPKGRFAYAGGTVSIEGSVKVTAEDAGESFELEVPAACLETAYRKAGLAPVAPGSGQRAQPDDEQQREALQRACARAKKTSRGLSGLFKPGRSRAAGERGRS